MITDNHSRVHRPGPEISIRSGPPPGGLVTPRETAFDLLDRGFWPVAIHPRGGKLNGRVAEGKEPIGKGWGLDRWTRDRLSETFRKFPDAGIGICLGPDRAPGGGWLTDIEGDGPEAEASRAILFGGEVLETMGWGSARGAHGLLTIDPDRLLPILARLRPFESKERNQPGVYHLPNLSGLELRIGGFKADGTPKQIQSVVPPTAGTDGTPRRWNGAETVAAAPGAFYAALEATAEHSEELPPTRRAAAVVPRPAGPGGPAVERYGRIALDAECSAVATAAEGMRNIRLNLAAFKVGRLVGAGAIARPDAERTLAEAGRRGGLGAAEINATIRGAVEAGMRVPRDLSHVAPGDGKYGVNGKAGSGSPFPAAPAAELGPGPTSDRPGGRPAEAAEAGEVEVIDRWPRADPLMFQGIAGDIVDLVRDQTEADPVAILIQFLVAFANLVGRSPHFVVGATHHYLNLFVALVGFSAVARKGTSWDIVRWLLATSDQVWADDRIQTGLVSGEGLIHHVRDRVTRRVRARNGAGKGIFVNGDGDRAGDGDEIEVDPGVVDKRLLIVETELSRTFKAMNRESNTLSDVIRQAYDGGNLRTLGKNNPVKATGAHIAIIGHCTPADVRRHLTETESANGFANRFLWACVRRSKDLPDGGDILGLDWRAIRGRLQEAAAHARGVTRMMRDDAAAKLWRAVYGELNEGHPGLLGAMLGRAVPHAMRLACIFALLDRERAVRAPHLKAALAVWKYCEDSTRFVFGDALGDPDAEKLLGALRAAAGGLPRTDITVAVFGRHKKSGDIAKLLSELLAAGLIHRTIAAAPSGGRPAERWHLGRGEGGRAN